MKIINNNINKLLINYNNNSKMLHLKKIHLLKVNMDEIIKLVMYKIYQ